MTQPTQDRELIVAFYTAFQRRDHQAMAACYHPDVVFWDPVFGELKGWRAAAMWRMLCERGKDLQLTFDRVAADGRGSGSAQWEARYTFSATGRAIHNRITADFEFRDGLISRHTDRFDLHAWLGMALGLPGKVLGWFPPLQNLLRRRAARGLEDYLVKRGLEEPR